MQGSIILNGRLMRPWSMASHLTKPFRIGTSILTKTLSFRSFLFCDGSKAPMHRHEYRDDDASGMQNWRAKGFGACRSTLTQFVSLEAFSSSVPPVAVSFWTLQQDVSVSLKPYLSYRRKTGDDLVQHFWEAVANQWPHWPVPGTGYVSQYVPCRERVFVFDIIWKVAFWWGVFLCDRTKLYLDVILTSKH